MTSSSALCTRFFKNKTKQNKDIYIYISLTSPLASLQIKVVPNTELSLTGITTGLSLHSALAWKQSREEARCSPAPVTGLRHTWRHVVLPPSICLTPQRQLSVCVVRLYWPCSWRYPSWRRTCRRVWSSCPNWLKRWTISRLNTDRIEKSASPLSGPGNITDQLWTGGSKFTASHPEITTRDVADWHISLSASRHVYNCLYFDLM